MAALFVHKGMAKAFVAKGADVNATDNRGSSALGWLKEIKIVDDQGCLRDTSIPSAKERVGRKPTGSFVIDVDMSSSKGVKER
jgi:hypothetical protein